jgi:hypothetical protein
MSRVHGAIRVQYVSCPFQNRIGYSRRAIEYSPVLLEELTAKLHRTARHPHKKQPIVAQLGDLKQSVQNAQNVRKETVAAPFTSTDGAGWAARPVRV